MKFLSFFAIGLISISCYLGEELPPDQNLWEYDDPSKNGLSENILLDIDSLIAVGFFESITGLIIIKNDKLIYENYYNNSDRYSYINLDRASIVFTVAAMGIAIDEGLLNITDPIHTHLPGYRSIFDLDLTKEQITIEHLLTHRSGFSWNETVIAVVDNPNNNLNQVLAVNDRVEFVLNQPLEAVPGFRYNFNSATGPILTKIIENASGQRFDEFLADNLLSPLDITSFSIETDPSGNFDGGRGISTTLMDWTRFGYMMLEEGIWNNRKVVDPNFITEVTSFQSSVSQWYNFGYGWWLFGPNFENSFAVPGSEIYFIPGEIGQHQYIIPSQNMIISISAENFFFGFGNPSLNLFAQTITSIQ